MRPALLLCVLSLVLAACGAESRDSAGEFTGAQRGVAAAVEDLESAARKNESEKACTKLLSARLLATLKERGTDCETALEDAFRDADTLDLTVEEVTIRGTTASAKVTSGKGEQKRTDTLELEKVGAAWRISSLTA
jgi:hypothetical protein